MSERLPEWSGEDWDNGYEQESSAVLDGNVTFSIMPEGAIFDGWDDGKLTGRDTFQTTPYEYSPISGNTNNTRPEWEIQKDNDGTITASNSVLEYSWGTSTPVTLVGARSNFDVSNGATIYIVFEMGSPQGYSTRVSMTFAIQSDATVRNGDSGINISFNTDNHVSLDAGGNQITSSSPTINSGVVYGLLLDRDSSGNWSIYFDPEDPANPQSGELVAEGQDTFTPDMSGSDSGVNFTTANGHGNTQFVHRLEMF